MTPKTYPAPPLPLTAFAFEAVRDRDLSAYGKLRHTHHLSSGISRVLLGVLGHREYSRTTQLQDGWRKVEILCRYKSGRIGVSQLVLRVRLAGEVAAPQYGQVWLRPGGDPVLLMPCPRFNQIAEFSVFNLTRKYYHHTSHQLELLDCGYRRVHELPWTGEC